MDIFYFAAGALVISVAHFKMELLVQRSSFWMLLVVSFLLFICGLVLHFTEFGRSSMSGALLSPLLSFGLFHCLRTLFLKRFGREPADTFLNWNAGLGADRMFNVIYFTSAALLLMVLPFGMQMLARAGW